MIFKFFASRINKAILLCFVLQFLFFSCFSQGIGNGSDGSPNISEVINRYASVQSIIDSLCGTIMNVDNSTGFSAGDLILIMQMQGATIDTSDTTSYGTLVNYNNSGNFEYAKIDTVIGNKITTDAPILNNYTIGGVVQIIRVPQYSNPIITGQLGCLPWNGSTGGVLALDAIGTITLGSDLNTDGQGFRGGIVQDDVNYTVAVPGFAEEVNPELYSLKGEGIAGYGVPPKIAGRGAPANGGGGGNSHNSSGGGGSNVGCGGQGGYGYENPSISGPDVMYCDGLGGHPFLYDTTNQRIFLGGGGGASHSNNNTGTNGGNGGGVILISSNAIIGNSNIIESNGNTALAGSDDGAGGGGAGGSILIHCKNISGLQITANGGSGGDNLLSVTGWQLAPGGGGGGGIIWFSGNTIPPGVTASFSNGLAGICFGCSSVHYGATDGCAGTSLTNLKLLIGLSSIQHLSFDTSICNNILTLEAPGGQNYQWSPSTGLSCDTCQNPVATLSQSTNYIVTFTANGGCQVVDTFKVKVNSISVNATTNSKPIYCSGDTIQLHAHVSPDTSSNVIYNWTPTAGLSCTNCPDPVSAIDSSINYIVNVTSASGCTASDTVHVTAQKIALTTSPANICIGDSAHLQTDFSLDTLIGVTYQWTPSSGLSCTTCPDPFANPGSTTTYSITVTTPAGCSAEDSAIVTVRQKDIISLTVTPSSTIIAGDSVQLNASGGINYTWTPPTGLSCTNCPNPVAKPDTTISYFVMSNDGNCSSKDTITIFVLPACKDLALPTAFTPNGDGHNDMYHLLYNAKGNLQLKYFRIYNRWGQVVFDTENLLTGWDGKFNGKPESVGTYIWVVDAICNGKEIFQKGNVTLLR